MSEDVNIGDFNTYARHYSLEYVKSETGSQRNDYIYRGDVLVSIQDEKLEGKSINDSFTMINALQVIAWDFPVKVGDKIIIAEEEYIVITVANIMRNYYKKMLIQKNELS